MKSGFDALSHSNPYEHPHLCPHRLPCTITLKLIQTPTPTPTPALTNTYTHTYTYAYTHLHLHAHTHPHAHQHVPYLEAVGQRSSRGQRNTVRPEESQLGRTRGVQGHEQASHVQEVAKGLVTNGCGIHLCACVCVRVCVCVCLCAYVRVGVCVCA